jgi:hypothetical protein
MRDSRRRRILVVLSLCGFWFPPAPSAAQQPVDRTRIKRNQEAIFNTPELRYLKTHRSSNDASGDHFPSTRSGQGGDGAGDARGNLEGGRENGDPPHRDDRQARRGNPPADTEPRDSSWSRGGGDFGSGAAGLFQILGSLAIAAMVVAIILMLINSLRDRESSRESDLSTGDALQLGEIEPERPPGLTPSEEFLRQARELARRGEFREAIARLLLGAMSEIERRGLIRYRRGLTQRDYFRAIRKQRELAGNYRRMLKIYEPLGFGGRVATERHFRETLQRFEAGFREQSTFSDS